MSTPRCLSLLAVCLVPILAQAADPPPVKLALAFKPSQPEIDYDIPKPAEYDQCKVAASREGKLTGWLVTGPQGQLLRRYMDTDGNGDVDQFSYYRSGVEVYRDLDTNGNNKPDQSRWLNIGGARWGVDSNEDGRIDSWKRISAEETCQLAVKALISQDASLIGTLLVTREDLRSLGIKGDLEARIMASVSEPGAKLKKAAGSPLITPKTTLMRFDGANPGAIPAEQWRTTADLTVYENAMAIVDPGDNKPGLVQIGEMLRIGDAWKLTGLPQPIEGNQVEVAMGFLVSPEGTDATGTSTIAEGLSDDERKLVEQLQALDKSPPPADASRKEQARYNLRRADLAATLRKLAKSESLQEQWLRQEIDSITAAGQADPAPEISSRLKSAESEIRRASGKSPLAAYVTYRRMLVEHALEMQQADSNEDRVKVNERSLKVMEGFVKEFPQADETADTLFQLAMNSELAGKMDDARKWYVQITRDFKAGPAFEKASGAIRRLDLAGKPLVLAGTGLDGDAVDVKSYRGQTVLVLFWATWSKPYEEDLPELRKLYQERRGKGLEVLGVNLDDDKAAAQGHVSQQRLEWPQIYSAGGLESDAARTFGLISLPTMFLVDPTGKVVNRSISVADLKAYLQKQE